MTHQASILAVGTEITTGQILNRNAAWISEKLVNLGIDVVLHETVADDRPMIRKALDHCAQMSQLIFVTGGLGPTSDDFTREVVADWLKKPLEFHESAWQQIIQRLTSVGIPVAESNRQQCYFPIDSKILPNPQGTAAAFTSTVPSMAHHQIWVLPGPPHEISAIWDQGIDNEIRKIRPELMPLRLLTWQCMGKSEAELGEITEKALSGSHLQIGYRAHRPYVEIKVWCPEFQLKEKQPWIQKLDSAIAPWVMTIQGEDLAARFLTLISKKSDQIKNIKLYDSASGGIFAQRMSTVLKGPAYPAYKDIQSKITVQTDWAISEAPEDQISRILNEAHKTDDHSMTLAIAGFTPDGRATLGLRQGNQLVQESLQLPYRNLQLIDRMQAYIVEIALKRWTELLE